MDTENGLSFDILKKIEYEKNPVRVLKRFEIPQRNSTKCILLDNRNRRETLEPSFSYY